MTTPASSRPRASTPVPSAPMRALVVSSRPVSRASGGERRGQPADEQQRDEGAEHGGRGAGRRAVGQVEHREHDQAGADDGHPERVVAREDGGEDEQQQHDEAQAERGQRREPPPAAQRQHGGGEQPRQPPQRPAALEVDHLVGAGVVGVAAGPGQHHLVADARTAGCWARRGTSCTRSRPARGPSAMWTTSATHPLPSPPPPAAPPAPWPPAAAPLGPWPPAPRCPAARARSTGAVGAQRACSGAARRRRAARVVAPGGVGLDDLGVHRGGRGRLRGGARPEGQSRTSADQRGQRGGRQQRGQEHLHAAARRRRGGVPVSVPVTAAVALPVSLRAVVRVLVALLGRSRPVRVRGLVEFAARLPSVSAPSVVRLPLTAVRSRRPAPLVARRVAVTASGRGCRRPRGRGAPAAVRAGALLPRRRRPAGTRPSAVSSSRPWWRPSTGCGWGGTPPMVATRARVASPHRRCRARISAAVPVPTPSACVEADRASGLPWNRTCVRMTACGGTSSRWAITASAQRRRFPGSTGSCAPSARRSSRAWCSTRSRRARRSTGCPARRRCRSAGRSTRTAAVRTPASTASRAPPACCSPTAAPGRSPSCGWAMSSSAPSRSTACAATCPRRCSRTGPPRKPAYVVRLAGGTELVTSGEHRFLTAHGWRHVSAGGAAPGGAPTCGRGRRCSAPDRSARSSGRARRPHSAGYRRGYLCGLVRGDGPSRRRAPGLPVGRGSSSRRWVAPTTSWPTLAERAAHARPGRAGPGRPRLRVAGRADAGAGRPPAARCRRWATSSPTSCAGPSGADDRLVCGVPRRRRRRRGGAVRRRAAGRAHRRGGRRAGGGRAAPAGLRVRRRRPRDGARVVRLLGGVGGVPRAAGPHRPGGHAADWRAHRSAARPELEVRGGAGARPRAADVRHHHRHRRLRGRGRDQPQLLRPQHPHLPRPRRGRRLRPPDRRQGQRGAGAASASCARRAGPASRWRWAPTPIPTSARRAATG